MDAALPRLQGAAAYSRLNRGHSEPCRACRKLTVARPGQARGLEPRGQQLPLKPELLCVAVPVRVKASPAEVDAARKHGRASQAFRSM